MMASCNTIFKSLSIISSNPAFLNLTKFATVNAANARTICTSVSYVRSRHSLASKFDRLGISSDVLTPQAVRFNAARQKSTVAASSNILSPVGAIESDSAVSSTANGKYH